MHPKEKLAMVLIRCILDGGSVDSGESANSSSNLRRSPEGVVLVLAPSVKEFDGVSVALVGAVVLGGLEVASVLSCRLRL